MIDLLSCKYDYISPVCARSRSKSSACTQLCNRNRQRTQTRTITVRLNFDATGTGDHRRDRLLWKERAFSLRSLEKLSEDALSYVINDNELKLAKFAYAFTILLRETNGSITGSTQIKEEEIKVETPEEKPTAGDKHYAWSQYLDEEMRARGGQQICHGYHTPDEPLPRNNNTRMFLESGKCRLCRQPVKPETLDNHIQLFHGEFWRKEVYRCPMKVCDFRSVVPLKHLGHARKHHDRSLLEYYEKELGVECPYCSRSVATVMEYMSHMENHPEMLISPARIHVCTTCGFRSARMFHMIDHFQYSRRCASGSLRFDYDTAKAVYANTVARVHHRRVIAAKRTMPELVQPQKKPRDG